MGGSNAKIKRGMKGSNGGKGRWEYTEVLKSDSKKARRSQGKDEANDQLADLLYEKERLAEVSQEINILVHEKSEIHDKITQLLDVRKAIEMEIVDLEASV